MTGGTANGALAKGSAAVQLRGGRGLARRGPCVPWLWFGPAYHIAAAAAALFAMRGCAPQGAAACWTAAVVLVVLLLPASSMTCRHTTSRLCWCAGMLAHVVLARLGHYTASSAGAARASCSRGPGLAGRQAAGAPTLYLPCWVLRQLFVQE